MPSSPSAWRLRKVISGCQTGADQAGLFAAEALGICTGGWVTRDNRTESGSRMDLVDRFGLACLPTDDYAVRTLHNVNASDGTVIFGSFARVEERGTALTARLVAVYKGASCLITNPTAEQLNRWIRLMGIEVLNVAGPRLSRDPGVYDQAFGVLVDGLQETPGAVAVAKLRMLLRQAPRRGTWGGRP